MLNGKEMELAKRFFDRELSEEEMIYFEDRIINDEAFRKEVETYGQARHMIIQLVSKNKKGNIVSEHNQPKKRKRSFHLLLLFIFFLIFILGKVLYQKYNTKKIQKIIAQTEQFTKSISNDVMRSDNKDETFDILIQNEREALDKILDNYNNQNYDEADKTLRTIMSTSLQPESREIFEWWSVSLSLKKGDSAGAKKSLKKIMNKNEYNSKKMAKKIFNQF